MNPPINFLPATATPDRFSAFLVADVRCASAAGRRDNANTASDRQRRSAHRRSFASGGTTTRPQLTDNEATFAGATAVTRTAFATAAPATIYPRLAICAGSTGGAFTQHAWLTTISWQQGTLEIKGLTTSITALNALETSLRQDASFHLNQRGATQQDAQGRWQFEYQLTRKVSDEHVL